MSDIPYITYPNHPAGIQHVGQVVSQTFVNEPGKVSFGVIDYVPGWFISLHHHNTWELILVDSGSAGPGFVMMDGRWWRADPGSAVYVPQGYPHAWSSGNTKGFKMLWTYPGSHQEAGRLYDIPPEQFAGITPDQERTASTWPGRAT